MNDQDRYMAKELSGNVTASDARCVTNLSTGTSCETINFTAEALGNNFHAQECLPADTTTVGQDDQHFMFNPLPYTNEHGILASTICTPELNALGAWQPWPSSSLQPNAFINGFSRADCTNALDCRECMHRTFDNPERALGSAMSSSMDFDLSTPYDQKVVESSCKHLKSHAACCNNHLSNNTSAILHGIPLRLEQDGGKYLDVAELDDSPPHYGTTDGTVPCYSVPSCSRILIAPNHYMFILPTPNTSINSPHQGEVVSAASRGFPLISYYGENHDHTFADRRPTQLDVGMNTSIHIPTPHAAGTKANIPRIRWPEGLGTKRQPYPSMHFSPEEDGFLAYLKETLRLPWSQIYERHKVAFRERSLGSLQVRYSTKIKDRNAANSTNTGIYGFNWHGDTVA